MDYVTLSLQHDTYLDENGPLYDWTEVGENTGNFVHRTLLVDHYIQVEGESFELLPYDNDMLGCHDELVCVTVSRKEHRYIARASAMKSPLLRMLLEHTKKWTLHSFSHRLPVERVSRCTLQCREN